MELVLPGQDDLHSYSEEHKQDDDTIPASPARPMELDSSPPSPVPASGSVSSEERIPESPLDLNNVGSGSLSTLPHLLLPQPLPFARAALGTLPPLPILAPLPALASTVA